MDETWPTLPEAAQATRIPERTLARRIKEGSIRREWKPQEKRKPVMVLNPEDLALLVQKNQNKAVKVLPPAKPPTAKLPAPRNKLLEEFLAHKEIRKLIGLLFSVLEAQSATQPKDYYTLKEASKIKGLPIAYLRRQCQTGTLPAVKVAGWRIKREDLKSHSATVSIG